MQNKPICGKTWKNRQKILTNMQVYAKLWLKKNIKGDRDMKNIKSSGLLALSVWLSWRQKLKLNKNSAWAEDLDDRRLVRFCDFLWKPFLKKVFPNKLPAICFRLVPKTFLKKEKGVFGVNRFVFCPIFPFVWSPPFEKSSPKTPQKL